VYILIVTVLTSLFQPICFTEGRINLDRVPQEMSVKAGSCYSAASVVIVRQ